MCLLCFFLALYVAGEQMRQGLKPCDLASATLEKPTPADIVGYWVPEGFGAPIDIGASQRALSVLQATGLADPREFREIRRVLTAAALTYVAGLLDRLGFFLALLFVAEAARRVMT